MEQAAGAVRGRPSPASLAFALSPLSLKEEGRAVTLLCVGGEDAPLCSMKVHSARHLPVYGQAGLFQVFEERSPLEAPEQRRLIELSR